MAYDTDNNVAVSGFSGEAVIATDYSSIENNHFQVVKIAFGNTGEVARVTSSNGLPVTVQNSTIDVQLTSVAAGAKIGINGNAGIFGVAGATAVGVTASDLDIRSLTAGDPSAGLAAGADFVRVVGLSGAWPVGITATNLSIRALTAGDPTTAGAAGQDTVRIVGYSGGWPVGVTAVDLDIRSLTYGSDSVSVLNTVVVESTEDPFVFDPYFGFQTRVLRASIGPTQTTTGAGLSAVIPGVEDTVRVVGLSGAWPVNTFSHGLTNINNYDTKLPMLVDSTGALAVYLAAGSISVTADVSGFGITLTNLFTIAGVCAAGATQASQVLQIHGYTGPGLIPIAVTANDLDIRGLSFGTDSITVTGNVGVTNTSLSSMSFAVAGGNNSLRVTEASMSTVSTNVRDIELSTGKLSTNFETAGDSTLISSPNNVKMIKVDVQRIAQPTGGTSGRISAPTTPATQMGASTLQSGIHFKSDLGNSGVVFVGFNNQVTSQIGFPLYAGDQIFIETDNLNKMFVASTVSGSTVYFIGT